MYMHLQADSTQDESRQSKQQYFDKPINQLKRYESLLKVSQF